MSTPTQNLLITILCLCICCPVCLCDKKYAVVDEFDAARVSNHYQVRILGMDIFTLRSKPVLSLLKENEDAGDEQTEATSDFFSLDWDSWWSERGEPVLEALKQNPHFVAAVCLIVAVVRGLRSSALHQQVDIKALAHELVTLLPGDGVQSGSRMDELILGLQEVRRNQDVIARAFARVICLLREREPVLQSDDSH